MFDQIHGKEISYNNLLDINAAVDLIDEFKDTTFAILKHNNACGLASRPTVLEAWNDALAGDPVSAFGGVLITNAVIDKAAAEEINKIFFEVIIAPDYDVDALEILGQKKNRIILVRKPAALPKKQFRSLLNGIRLTVLHNLVCKEHILNFLCSGSLRSYSLQFFRSFHLKVAVLNQYAIQQRTELLLRQSCRLADQDNTVLLLTEDFQRIHIIIGSDNHLKEN